MQLENLEPFPPESNPFRHDLFHMGVHLGSNVTVMYRNHSSEPCPYLIIVNTETGERVRVRITEQLPDDILPTE